MNRRIGTAIAVSLLFHAAVLFSPSVQTQAEFAVDPGRARVEVQLRPKRKPVVKKKRKPKAEEPVVAKKAEPEPEPEPEEEPPPPIDEPGAIVDAKPDYLRNPPPVYPERARRRRIEGRVLLLVEVTAKGRPASVSIESSSGSDTLDESAVNAVKEWRFKPGTVMGVPARTTVRVPIRFRLNDRGR